MKAFQKNNAQAGRKVRHSNRNHIQTESGIWNRRVSRIGMAESSGHYGWWWDCGTGRRHFRW